MKINKALIIIATFFFGGIGLHKYLEGKYVKGILYGLFCWTFVPSILAFFALIGYCRKQADENGYIII